MSIHVQGLSYDVMSSDGASVGDNPDTTTNGSIRYIWCLLDGAHEEQHVFNITGLPWKKEITDVFSPLVQSQTIGISEAFNLHIDEPYAAGDYLYYSGGIDDLWLGLWGNHPGLFGSQGRTSAPVRHPSRRSPAVAAAGSARPQD